MHSRFLLYIRSFFFAPGPCLGLLLLVSILPGCGDSAENPLSGRFSGFNIVIIAADSLNADHLSCYGYHRQTSPAIDKFATQGIRFANACSQTSWTLSSVASLFTSLEQERHGVLRIDEILGRQPSTIAELFLEKGYRTAGLVQNSTIWSHTGLDRGFETYERFTWKLKGTTSMMRRAEEVLLEKTGKPMFVYIHLMPPHQPYEPPHEYRHRYDPDYRGDVNGSIASCARVNRSNKTASHPDVKHLAALYDGHIAWVDKKIGYLLDTVMVNRPFDRFLFLITSDHGEAFMQHGAQGHNTHVYEEMIRVPLIFLSPGGHLGQSRTIEEPVSLIDLFPTLVELCGLSRPSQKVNGLSLAGLLSDDARSLDRALFFTSRYSSKETPSIPQMAVRSGRYKLVLPEYQSGAAALYDLSVDPEEARDIRMEHADLADRMENTLRSWYAQARAEQKKQGTARSTPLSEEVLQQLEALGYTGDG